MHKVYKVMWKNVNPECFSTKEEAKLAIAEMRKTPSVEAKVYYLGADYDTSDIDISEEIIFDSDEESELFRERLHRSYLNGFTEGQRDAWARLAERISHEIKDIIQNG